MSESERSPKRTATDDGAAVTCTTEQTFDRLINVLEPDVIVLGGGLSNIERLYEAIPARWGAYVFSDRVDTRLVRAAHGDSSGVRGAAWLWETE